MPLTVAEVGIQLGPGLEPVEGGVRVAVAGEVGQAVTADLGEAALGFGVHEVGVSAAAAALAVLAVGGSRAVLHRQRLVEGRGGAEQGASLGVLQGSGELPVAEFRGDALNADRDPGDDLRGLADPLVFGRAGIEHPERNSLQAVLGSPLVQLVERLPCDRQGLGPQLVESQCHCLSSVPRRRSPPADGVSIAYLLGKVSIP